jgi:predicted AAA+ superfamily ATPase
LLNQLIAADGGELRNLDDEAILQAALNDPAGFVQSELRPLCIDEVQHGRDALVRAVKSVVDKDKARGQFVLAGSTRFLGDPTLHESLAGRAGVLEVLPFSESELMGTRGDFLDVAFAGGVPELRRRRPSPTSREEYFEMMVRGGFPEVAG